MKMSIARAADALLGGGIITCPTEGVYGLSCMPDDPQALMRLLALKRRDPAKGLILIAATRAQLDGWVDADENAIPDPDPLKPVTWITTANADVSRLVRGDHAGLAVRLTTNPTARDICAAVGMPVVSTSANLAGRTTARNQFILRRQFAGCVDYIVPGRCGPATGPSEIRDLQTGKILRAHTP